MGDLNLRKLFILLTIGLPLFVARPAFGQARTEPAFVVLNNGDTIRGWVNYKGWEHSPRSIEFSRDSTNYRFTIYRAPDIRYFEIAEAEAYERAVVRKKVINPADSLTTDTLLLRLLVKGRKLSLYEESSDQFFVNEEGGIFEEVSPFILKSYAQKYELTSLFPQIDAAGTSQEDVVRIVLALNGSSGAVTYGKPVMPNRLHWYLGVGGGTSGMSISGDKSYLGQISFSNTTVAPYLLLGFDYLFSKGVGPWGIRLEVAYFGATYKASGFSTGTELDHIDYTLDQRNISLAVYALYHFVNGRRLIVYGAAGISANFASYPQNTYHDSWPNSMTRDNYAKMSSFWFAANLKLGVILNNRFEAGAAGIFGNYSQELAYSFDPHTVLFWVGYRLR